MAETGIFRLPHQAWQRANVIAAATYLSELLAANPGNVRVKVLHEGLLDVLDPTRRVARQQRELSRPTGAERVAERRAKDRRTGIDRRQKDIGVPEIFDRRKGERRTGQDRRRTARG